MKAIAVVPAKKEVRLIDHEEPRLVTPTQVKLRILDVGVCGTDKEICAFDYGTPPSGSEWLVIGHESLGQVVEVGRGVSRLRIGDLVVPTVRRACTHAHCRACRSGRQDFCLTGDFTERGIKGQHGFMTEWVVDDESFMNVVPSGLRDVGVLVEPLTIAEKALLQLRRAQKRLPWMTSLEEGEPIGRGQKAVVLGAGPVGILGAMALVVAGFETIVYSRDPAPNKKSTLLESIGVGYVSSETTTVDQLAEKVGNIDLVYEAVGASRIAFDVMRALGTNGAFVFTGVPGRKAPVEVDTDLIMRNLVLKNQMVFGTVNAGRDGFEAAIADLATFVTRWPAAVRSLITGRFPIEAHRDLLLGRAGGIKNVISMKASA
ncbi:MAG: glucose 1-dehydrogenase [Planctomycetes bacterium]|nr:glucose 1-dehydrogenase [Planctomycetota bacterium]MBI3843752.1 glucose 1-dehydrogenase [Planctomycetota bacterium]